MGVAGRKRADGGDDFGMHVRHDARLAEGNADAGQLARQEMQVRIAGAAGKDLVSDHQDRGCRVAHDRDSTRFACRYSPGARGFKPRPLANSA